MALRKPLVNMGGRVQELPPGDQIDIELDSIKLTNKDSVTIVKLSIVSLHGTEESSVKLALADTFVNGHVLGIATESMAVDAQGIIQTDGLISGSVSEWDARIEGGSATGLTFGAIYYVSKTELGKITTVPPVAPGVISRVGRAVSSTVLDINIDYPIVLS